MIKVAGRLTLLRHVLGAEVYGDGQGGEFLAGPDGSLTDVTPVRCVRCRESRTMDEIIAGRRHYNLVNGTGVRFWEMEDDRRRQVAGWELICDPCMVIARSREARAHGALKEACGRIEGSSYEHPGYLAVCRDGISFHFGFASGSLGGDYGPAGDPGAPRSGVDRELSLEDSGDAGCIVAFIADVLVEVGERQSHGAPS